MILIRPFIHAFSLSSILPFSHSHLFSPSICLSIRPTVQFIRPSIQSVHPSVYSFHLSLHLSSQSIRSVHPTMLSGRIFICLSICPSVCLFGRSFHLSVCPSDKITVCPICLLVPPSAHLSIHTIHPFSLSCRPSVQSVHLSICLFRPCVSVHLSFQGTIWSNRPKWPDQWNYHE